MHLFLCSLTIGLAVLSGTALAADKCHLRELDLCAASAAGATKVPANDAEVDKYCAEAKESKECVDAYVSQCTTPIQKELYNWAVKDPTKETHAFCKKGSPQRNEYLKHAPCLASAQPDGKKCTDDVHAALEKLEKAKFSDRIPFACCIFQRYEKCSEDVVQAKCGQEALDSGARALTRHLGVNSKVLCSSFDPNGSVCRGLLPRSGTKASGNSRSIIGRLFSTYVGQ